MLKVTITGADAIMKRIREYEAHIKEMTEFETEEGARDILATAIANITTNDEGIMRNSGDVVRVADYDFAVVFTAFWSVYIEFGTGEKFEGQGFDEYARQFKGKRSGATWDQFVDNILGWIRRKGIQPQQEGMSDEELAEIIATRIYYEGLEARPFLFPALIEHAPKIIARLKEQLNNF
jgi:hypothetical protein